MNTPSWECVITTVSNTLLLLGVLSVLHLDDHANPISRAQKNKTTMEFYAHLNYNISRTFPKLNTVPDLKPPSLPWQLSFSFKAVFVAF